jgi:hypothetical protein
MKDVTRRRLLGGSASALAALAFVPAMPRIARAAASVPPPSGSPATDQTNLEAALLQSAQPVVFPDNAAALSPYQMTRSIWLGQGSSCPPAIFGNGATLQATASCTEEMLRITNPQVFWPRFEMGRLNLDGAGFPYRALTIHGMFEAYVHDLVLKNVQSMGLACDAEHNYGIYACELARISIYNSAWVGARFATVNLNDYYNLGSHFQGNDVHGLKIMNCAGGGIYCSGAQGQIRNSICESNGNVGIYIDHSLELTLSEMYFESNIPTGSTDTCVFVDDSTVSSSPEGVKRVGGRWIGQVIGTVH